MRYLIHLIVLLIFLFPIILSGQGRGKIDPALIQRVDELNDQAFDTSGEQSKAYALEAYELAKKAGYQKGLIDSYMRLGDAATSYEEAANYYQMALTERRKVGYLPDVASCYNQLGRLQKNQSHYESAANLYLEGIKIMEGSGILHENLSALYNNLGFVYGKLGKYQDAQLYLTKNIQMLQRWMAESPGDSVLQIIKREYALGLLNMGEFLQNRLNRYEEAEDTLEASLSLFQEMGKQSHVRKCLILLGNNSYYLGDLGKAQNYFEEGIELDSVTPSKDLFILFRNRGRIFLEKGQYSGAMSDLQKALSGFSEIQNEEETAATQFEMGNFFFEQTKLDSAVHYYKNALDHPIEDPLLRARLLFFLSDALFQSGEKEEAAGITGEYISALDSLNAEQTRGAFNQLISYQIDKNRLSRTLADRDKQKAQFERQNIRNYFILAVSLSALLLLLAVQAIRLNRQKRRSAENEAQIARQQEELARQNEQLAIQEKLDLLKDKELETNFARLAGQEEMQKKIGDELHDGVGAMLTSVKLNLAPVDEVLDQLPQKNQDLFKLANKTLDEACQEVRRISHELSSAVLNRFGLKAQLEALADAISASGKIQVELSTHGLKERLDSKTEHNIYRMVQELVNNVIKHAQAKNITIQVNRFEHSINIMVEDDGRGFDAEKVRQAPGIGMQNIASRLHGLDGKIEIDSSPGRGTTVSIDIPVL